MQGVEVVNSSLWSPKGLQRASPCLSCHCPDGHDDRRMDRGPGQPDSENRKPYLSKIIQGEGEVEEAMNVNQHMALVEKWLPVWLGFLELEIPGNL